MAKTVNSAFNIFNQDFVNLDPNNTRIARNSRDWLITQLTNLPNKINDFPSLYDGKHIKFGSFARNTKIRPLDDIDLILTFSADETTYWTHSYGKSYTLIVPDTATNLRKLCSENSNYLNSIKLVNKLVASLKEIGHYKSADIHRRQEAATLKLTSYDWNFDIVPAFYTDTGYYLIPDGSGGWKATDPRIDQKRTTDINQKFNGIILQIIRTLKYWNRRAKMPTIPSYLFENLILNYFNSKDKISDSFYINMINFWHYLEYAIYNNVDDPKGFQDNLNTLTFEEKQKISNKAKETHIKGFEAYELEILDENTEKAINKWREIFGDDFPEYD